jgi:hypothetical protein
MVFLTKLALVSPGLANKLKDSGFVDNSSSVASFSKLKYDDVMTTYALNHHEDSACNAKLSTSLILPALGSNVGGHFKTTPRLDFNV